MSGVSGCTKTTAVVITCLIEIGNIYLRNYIIQTSELCPDIIVNTLSDLLIFLPDAGKTTLKIFSPERRREDSNLRGLFRPACFRNMCVRPLCHASAQGWKSLSHQTSFI